MSQAEQLDAIAQKFKAMPDSEMVNNALDTFTQAFKPSAAIQVGSKLPDFLLSDATGKQVSSADLLAKGPLLITFYRGGWCPYCNIALQFLQRHLDEFNKRGVTLVAMTPELPDYSMTTAQKNKIKFPVLTDLHNDFARKLGIIYDQSSAREIFELLDASLVHRNGDDSYEVPVPATLLVDATGVIGNAYVEPDYRKRMDPEVALKWIDDLNA